MLDALDDGATPEQAAVRGIMKRAEAKAQAAVKQGFYVREGQKSICGAESNNWQD